MGSLIWIMTAVVGTWALAAAAFVGLGLGARRMCGLRRPGLRATLDAFWMGWALTLLLLQFWHLALPVDGWATAMVILAGFAGLCVNAGPLSRTAGASLRRSPLGWLACVVLVVYLANRVIGPPTCLDSASYHLAVVQWNSAYPAVPGLANLQAELGAHGGSFLYAALLDTGPWTGKSHHLAHGLMLAALGVEALLALLRIVRRPRAATLGDLFRATMIIVVAHLATDAGMLNVSSLAPDVTALIVVLVIGARLIDLSVAPGSWGPRRRHEFFVVATLLAAAACVKVTALAFAGVAGLIVAGIYVARNGGLTRMPWRAPIAAGVTVALLLGGMAAHSIVVTGYPLYPLPLLGVGDWRVPLPILEQWTAWITLDPRGTNTLDEPWLGNVARLVYKAYRPDMLIPLGLAALALPAFLLGLAINRRQRPPVLWASVWLIPCAVGLAVWLLKAPHPRFGNFLAWTIAGIALGGATLLWRPTTRGWSPLMLAACLLLVTTGMLYKRYTTYANNVDDAHAYRGLVFDAGPEDGLYPTPTMTFTTYRTDSGLTVHRPTHMVFSWQGPLVRSPFHLPTLEQRDPDDVAEGFRLLEPVPDDIWGPQRRARLKFRFDRTVEEPADAPESHTPQRDQP